MDLVTVLSAANISENLVPPPIPAVAPLIGKTYPSDLNGDHVEDQLLMRFQEVMAARSAAKTAAQTNSAQDQFRTMIDVELIFEKQITQKQIDDFQALGGEITHIYKAISYGWNGRMPLSQVSRLPALMGGSLVLVEESKAAQLALRATCLVLPATPTSRLPSWIRAWTQHIPTSPGAVFFWQDYSTDAAASPLDVSPARNLRRLGRPWHGAASGSETGHA
ncbi:MAG: hypothetical protein WDM80_09095 [Limisphaerales bacterium]